MLKLSTLSVVTIIKLSECIPYIISVIIIVYFLICWKKLTTDLIWFYHEEAIMPVSIKYNTDWWDCFLAQLKTLVLIVQQVLSNANIVAQEGSTIWGNSLTPVLLPDQNRTKIRLTVIVHHCYFPCLIRKSVIFTLLQTRSQKGPCKTYFYPTRHFHCQKGLSLKLLPFALISVGHQKLRFFGSYTKGSSLICVKEYWTNSYSPPCNTSHHSYSGATVN